MDFWSAMEVLRRRWYVALPAILVAAVVAIATFISIPTQYTSTGVMVLAAPEQGGTFTQSIRPDDVKRINPLLAFDNSLNTASQIIIQVLKDPATEDTMGVTASTTLTITNGTVDQRGPFIVVTVVQPDHDGSRNLVARVLDRAGTELVDRQRALKAPESTFITSQVLVQPTEPAAQIGGKLRFTGAAALLGLFLAFAAPFAVESVVTSRRRRAARGESGHADDAGLNGRPIGPAPIPVGVGAPTASAAAPEQARPGGVPGPRPPATRPPVPRGTRAAGRPAGGQGPAAGGGANTESPTVATNALQRGPSAMTNGRNGTGTPHDDHRG